MEADSNPGQGGAEYLFLLTLSQASTLAVRTDARGVWRHLGGGLAPLLAGEEAVAGPPVPTMPVCGVPEPPQKRVSRRREALGSPCAGGGRQFYGALRRPGIRGRTNKEAVEGV